MADIKTLQEKVTKATETVQKKKATIVRHQKQLEKKIAILTKKGYEVTDEMLEKADLSSIKFSIEIGDEARWECYDVESKLNDIKGATKKLKDAETILENWQAKLSLEVEKERFLNDDAPQIIKDFLQEWRDKAYEWHVKRYDAYQNFKVKIKQEEIDAYAELGIKKGYPPTREQNKILKEKHLDYSSIQQRKSNFAGVIVLRMDSYRNEEERLSYLNKTLEEDKKNKMLDLINRINAVVGTITDATNLSIVGGNLNGIIIGEKGKAKVETIGAGGWNIQCWHYRTLVHKK